MEYKSVGLDTNDITRVWGVADNYQMAKFQARVEAEEYVKGRPDTGPLVDWTFVAVHDVSPFQNKKEEENDS